MEEKWVCRRCKRPLEYDKAVFEYLGYTASHELLCCPKCGRALVPYSLVREKISAAETLMEDK